MLNLYKMTEEEKREYNVPEEDHYYSFKEQEELLGFAKVNILEKPDIYIFIFEEKRGNGYGNNLFSKVLEIIKESGITSFELIFPLKNVKMTKIVQKYGGIEESRKEDMVKYTIVIR